MVRAMLLLLVVAWVVVRWIRFVYEREFTLNRYVHFELLSSVGTIPT